MGGKVTATGKQIAERYLFDTEIGGDLVNVLHSIGRETVTDSKYLQGAVAVGIPIGGALHYGVRAEYGHGDRTAQREQNE